MNIVWVTYIVACAANMPEPRHEIDPETDPREAEKALQRAVRDALKLAQQPHVERKCEADHDGHADRMACDHDRIAGGGHADPIGESRALEPVKNPTESPPQPLTCAAAYLAVMRLSTSGQTGVAARTRMSTAPDSRFVCANGSDRPFSGLWVACRAASGYIRAPNDGRCPIEGQFAARFGGAAALPIGSRSGSRTLLRSRSPPWPSSFSRACSRATPCSIRRSDSAPAFGT